MSETATAEPVSVPTPMPASRPRITVKQRFRLDDIAKEEQGVQHAAEEAVRITDAEVKKELRKLDEEMSRQVSASAKAQQTDIAVAAAERGKMLSRIEADRQKALAKVESECAKERNKADVVMTAARQVAGAKFAEATKPTEDWFKAEKLRIVAEATEKRDAVNAVLAADLGKLQAERESIAAKAKQATEKTEESAT